MITDDALRGWGSFYVIVGSSAGALTGLQFVVMALNADRKTLPRSEGGVSAFGTPTVVHFCFVLLFAAMLSAPWPAIGMATIAIRLAAIAGMGYTLVVIRRALRQQDYAPVAEDWIWHAGFPAIGYALVIAGSLIMATRTMAALFLIAGASLLLIFTGIHNAWDAAVYIATSAPAGGEAQMTDAERESRKEGTREGGNDQPT